MPLLWGAAVFLAGGAFLGGPAWMAPAGLVLLVAGLALYFRVGTVRRPPVEVGAPVAGRWEAVNSPADKVPSHGLHAYGQTYAIDPVHEPVDGSRPRFSAGPSFRPPADYPAFGQPVLTPADGVVVRATGVSGTTAASCSPPACRSGWTASRSTAPSRPGCRATASRSR